jgi:hypothetical protein
MGRVPAVSSYRCRMLCLKSPNKIAMTLIAVIAARTTNIKNLAKNKTARATNFSNIDELDSKAIPFLLV